MDRTRYYSIMNRDGDLDYEVYLNTRRLLSCQKDFGDQCNGDELQFQIVHQVEELWMKLIACTLLDIDDYLRQHNTNRVVTLFRRVRMTLRLMSEQLALLETMSPREYQEIRLQLGNGSGQESPGFRTLLQMPRELWRSFVEGYLEPFGLTVRKIYDTEYSHCDAYLVAELLIDFDELFQKFRQNHMQLIYRSIGMDVRSLKGRSVERLRSGAETRFFPELWDIRHEMTDAWGSEYGGVRESIG